MGTWKLLEDMMKKIEIFVHVLSHIVCVCLTLDCCFARSPRANAIDPAGGDATRDFSLNGKHRSCDIAVFSQGDAI
jgi:hypothetical protein